MGTRCKIDTLTFEGTDELQAFEIGEGVYEMIFQNEGDAPVRISRGRSIGGGFILQQQTAGAGGDMIYDKVRFRAPDGATFEGALYEIKFESVRPGKLNIVQLRYAN